jgi:alginate O-acetyltransferase complex protein AlgI
MLFNSFEFIFLFLPATFFLYYMLLSRRLFVGARAILIAASLFYYAWWRLDYLPIILLTLLFNFVIGTILSSDSARTAGMRLHVLATGIVLNLLLLGYYKYSDFIIENINQLSGAHFDLLGLTLPLAISFFTFQQIAYLVDSYRGQTKEYDFLNYALFVTFFPQLIAGPIVHHKEMMPQFESKWNLVRRYRNISAGLFIFSMGLFKKVIIADKFSEWANLGFDRADYLNMIEAWATSLSYTFQLYFDFSGYTDMAIGVALLFNIKLPINFNSPYKALTIRDFWRRWHITLSRFLRDYVYIPLGGNRLGEFRTCNNLMITFIIGGLWHGAGWTFLLWGMLHGSALVIHRLWQRSGIVLHRFLAWFITFNFVNIAWVFFRAESWSDAVKVLKGMFYGDIILSENLRSGFGFLQKAGVEFGQELFHLGGHTTPIAWVIAAFVVISFRNSIEQLENFKADYKHAAMTFVLGTYAILNMDNTGDFLYFNF